MLIKELVIDKNKLTNEVFALSLVGAPATDSEFVYLSKEDIQIKMSAINQEQKIIVALAMIPDLKMPRVDKVTGEPYEVFFSQETVRDAARMYMQREYNNESTVHHESKVENVGVIESWIVEDPNQDKTNLYGLNAPRGSWAVIMKIDNPIVEKEIKDGVFNGISIEGSFTPVQHERTFLSKETYESVINNFKSISDGEKD